MGAPLVLQGGPRRLSVRGGALIVEQQGEPVRSLRPEDVEEVHAFGDVELTCAARRALLHHGIDVVFHTRDGRVQGRLCSAESPAGERRLAQVRCVLETPRRLAVARAIVAGKIRNQHVGLTRVQRQVRSEPLADALATLRAMASAAGSAPDLERLLGIEGYASRAYFAALGEGLRNPLFSFTGRNRRPPRDPVNAVLSFLYTLLCQRTGQAARTAGLDPYVGFLHEAGRGREACAFDLAEAWRPVVDALAFGLFNRRQLSPEDFEDPGVDLAKVSESPEEAPPPPDPSVRPVYLGPVGRSVVLTAWARRLGERAWCPEREGRFPLEDLMRIEAQALARAATEPQPDFHPYAWR